MSCDRCGDEGFMTRMGGDLAVAERCACSAACAVCRGERVVFSKDDRGYEVARPCRCAGLDRRIRLFNLAQLPARYHAVTLESFEHRGGNQNEIKYLVLELRDRFRLGDRGVGLSGPPGVGKTHLLAALAAYLTLQRGMPVQFRDFFHLLWTLREGFSKGVGEAELVEPLVSAPILFVDELGKGKGSEWELGILDEIVSERYNRRLSTFFTTNFPLVRPAGAPPPAAWQGGGRRGTPDPAAVETLEDRLGSRVFSRLGEMCELRALDGPDARRQPTPRSPKPATAPRPPVVRPSTRGGPA